MEKKKTKAKKTLRMQKLKALMLPVMNSKLDQKMMKALKEYKDEFEMKKPKIKKSLTQDRLDRIQDLVSEINGSKTVSKRPI